MRMPRGLRYFLITADIAMLAYWLISALACLAVITLPQAAMYDGYGTPHIDSWNWSFAPLDIAFSIVGLMAIRADRDGDHRWVGLAIVSLCLTMCAGGMAISYWALAQEFSLSWWVPNLALLLLPMVWLPGLIGTNLRSQAQ